MAFGLIATDTGDYARGLWVFAGAALGSGLVWQASSVFAARDTLARRLNAREALH